MQSPAIIQQQGQLITAVMHGEVPSRAITGGFALPEQPGETVNGFVFPRCVSCRLHFIVTSRSRLKHLFVTEEENHIDLHVNMRTYEPRP